MRKIVVLIIAVCSFHLVFGQTPGIVQEISNFLKPGNYKVAVTTFAFPKEVSQLQQKALSSLSPAYKQSRVPSMIEEGDINLRFDTAYGLTREEFRIMINGFSIGKLPGYSDTSTISVTKVNGLIKMKCNKKLNMFDLLSIDINTANVIYDNLKLTKELSTEGKFYAPGLKGVEGLSSTEISTIKRKSDVGYFSLTVGSHRSDNKFAFCLGYGKIRTNDSRVLAGPEFLIMTVLGKQ